jgi:hypothetical protein
VEVIQFYWILPQVYPVFLECVFLSILSIPREYRSASTRLWRNGHSLKMGWTPP